MRFVLFLLLTCLCYCCATEAAEPVSFESAFQQLTKSDFLNGSQQFKIIAFVAALSLIPFVVIMMTSFTRISIIFHFLRQALGTAQVPSTQIITGLSLILTGFVMHPVFEEIYDTAFKPYIAHAGAKEGLHNEEIVLLERSWTPLRSFLLQHARETDLQLFLDLAEIKVVSKEASEGSAYEGRAISDASEIPWYCLIPAFVLSELRVAFMMGFLLFMPFLIIDMIVSSLLMSLGMMMLPPTMISMPFKLLLFILIDGWRLIIEQMVNGYHL